MRLERLVYVVYYFNILRVVKIRFVEEFFAFCDTSLRQKRGMRLFVQLIIGLLE